MVVKLGVINYERSDAFEEMKKRGVEVIQPDPQPWVQATELARKDLLSKIPNGDELYKDIVNAKK